MKFYWNTVVYDYFCATTAELSNATRTCRLQTLKSLLLTPYQEVCCHLTKKSFILLYNPVMTVTVISKWTQELEPIAIWKMMTLVNQNF